jgi:hypothetical protein
MGPFFKLFRCSNDFKTQKVYFLRLMLVYVGFNVSGVYLVQVSLLLIGQQGLGDFFRYYPLVPIGQRIVHIFSPTPEENDQYSANHS